MRLAAVAVGILVLCGCSATEDLTASAYSACQQNIDAQYDAVAWPASADVSVEGDAYTVIATVEADGQQSEATCVLTREDDSWLLSSYNVVAQ